MTLWSQAQVPGSNLRQRVFAVGADSIRLDTLSIIPQTFEIEGVPASDYRLDFINSILHWTNKPAADSVRIVYRVFFYKLNPVAQHMKVDSVINTMAIAPYVFNNDLSEDQKAIFNFGTLKAEGSFGRQIAFGNSQDAVLNSTLNLQLSGMLGDSIEIQAAITDNNIPIQPDGTTQQLNEFDQVYLQFKKRNWQLNLGDIDLRHDVALLRKHPGHGSRGAQIAVVLLQQVPHFADGSILVVRHALEDERRAPGTVPFVGDFLVGDAWQFTGAALDGLLDVVGRHVDGFGVGDNRAQPRVHVGVATTIARRDGEFLDDAGEDLATLRVGGPLLVLDGVPLGMAGH